MNIDRFLQVLKRIGNGKMPLDAQQQKVLRHRYPQPLWIIAGPGTGKTHTLTWLTLKRLLVDQVRPDRLILTTFTRKAAAELTSRLILSRQQFIDAGSTEAASIDLSELRLGTLHSLCSQILQDERYEPTLRIRVLEDELVQQFFIRRTWNPLMKCDDIQFWAHFGFIESDAPFPPSSPYRAKFACQLFNRMTENQVDLKRLNDDGDAHLSRVAQAYIHYREQLEQKGRTDQAHLQQHLLNFVATDSGRTWLGDGLTLLVDEYQDTNSIQEEVYFRLVGKKGSITVVGDDDQSLFRFRGATVESLVEFDK